MCVCEREGAATSKEGEAGRCTREKSDVVGAAASQPCPSCTHECRRQSARWTWGRTAWDITGSCCCGTRDGGGKRSGVDVSCCLTQEMATSTPSSYCRCASPSVSSLTPSSFSESLIPCSILHPSPVPKQARSSCAFASRHVTTRRTHSPWRGEDVSGHCWQQLAPAQHRYALRLRLLPHAPARLRSAAIVHEKVREGEKEREGEKR